MMRNRLQRWACTLLIASAGGGFLFINGCLLNVQNNLDVLWSPEASLDSVHTSWLFDKFGPGVLNFW
mgnify:CR=1 FL=1